MYNSTDAETLHSITVGTEGLNQTANELQELSNSMRNVSNDISTAMHSSATAILQDSVARICKNIDQHVSAIQTRSTDVRNVLNQCEQGVS